MARNTDELTAIKVTSAPFYGAAIEPVFRKTYLSGARELMGGISPNHSNSNLHTD